MPTEHLFDIIKKKKVTGIETRLTHIETDITGIKTEMTDIKDTVNRIENRQNAIFEQTAGLIEFRTGVISTLQEINENQKSISEVLASMKYKSGICGDAQYSVVQDCWKNIEQAVRLLFFSLLFHGLFVSY